MVPLRVENSEHCSSKTRRVEKEREVERERSRERERENFSAVSKTLVFSFEHQQKLQQKRGTDFFIKKPNTIAKTSKHDLFVLFGKAERYLLKNTRKLVPIPRTATEGRRSHASVDLYPRTPTVTDLNVVSEQLCL